MIDMNTLILSSTLACAIAAPDGRLPAIQPAGDFALVDQDGKPLAMKDLKGQVLLVGFVFTTCTGSCPATTQRMVLVQEGLQKKDLFKKGVRLISISLDPARDRPEVLRDYMKLNNIDSKSWSFLTGPFDDVKKAHAAWGMWAKPAANGQLDHPSRIFLVDRKGQVREIYNLDFMRPRWVVEDVEYLVGEK
jgi:protein SCO1/2